MKTMRKNGIALPPGSHSGQEGDFCSRNGSSHNDTKTCAGTLTELSDAVSRTSRNVNYSLNILVENLEHKVQRIKLLSSQAVYSIQEISLHTKMKLIVFGGTMFLSGVLITCGLYNVLLTNIMNSYLHKTVEKLAEKPVRQAEREAEIIIRNANIKADGMLKNIKSYSIEEEKNDKNSNSSE